MQIKQNLILQDGSNIPILGFGTWNLRGRSGFESILYALEIGYRHIDTADMYNNHTQVGKALRKSGIPREDIYLTTKVARNNLKKENVIQSGKRFLEELETDYIDLLLIHWPNNSIPIKDTLEGFSDLKGSGIIKSMGVSNFSVDQIKEAVENTDLSIVTNQIEYHPSLDQSKIEEFCKKENIAITAYSPLGQGKDLKIDVIKEIAKNVNKTPSQVILNWIVSKDIIAIPKSGNNKHIKENFDSLDFTLTAEEIQAIDTIAGNNRLLNPHFANF